jgi:hypothetical protein
MKHLRKFNESVNIYDIDWHSFVPKELTMVYDNNQYKFICIDDTNIMKHFDMIQITYNLVDESWGLSDCLEFDIYFVKPYNTKGIKILVDVTWGNFMGAEFSIQTPNTVSVIQCTSKDSKFDPTNTVFAFDDKSLESLVNFFNCIDNIKITKEDLKFLHKEGRCPIC